MLQFGANDPDKVLKICKNLPPWIAFLPMG